MHLLKAGQSDLVWSGEQKENGLLERPVLSFEFLVPSGHYDKLAHKYMKVLLQVIRCF